MPKTEMYTTKSGDRRFQVTAPVSEQTCEELRRLAFEQRTTMSAQVRQAVIEYLNRDRSNRRITPLQVQVGVAGRALPTD